MATKRNKANSTKKKGGKISVLSFLKDERLPKILGLIFMLFAFFMFISFASYLSTFKADQSEVLSNGLEVITDKEVEVKNALGSFGAIISNFFIRDLFGLASFLFIFLSFAYGTNLVLRKKMFPVLKITTYSLITMVWISMVLSYLNMLLHEGSGLAWGGAFGNYLTGSTGWLTAILKPIGTGALLIITTLIAAVWLFNINFNAMVDKLSGLMTRNKENGPAIDEDGFTTIQAGESIFEKDGIDAEPVLEKSETAEVELSNDPLAIKPETEESFEKVKNKIDKKNTETVDDVALDIAETKEEQIIEDKELEHKEAYDPTLDLSNYKFPKLDYLAEHGQGKVKIDADELERNKNQIIQTLNNYKIEISKIKATIGPTVTLYEIVPAPGVRISKIKNLEDDIALSLAALGIRIIAPIPGKGTIGIEVPNEKKEIVSMHSLIASEKFRNTKMDLPICLGKNISNEIIIADLAKMPHLLMAGATGQGKSVGINAILVSLLYKKHPSQIKFVMVDPKKVELSIYTRIEKHYLAKLPDTEEPIITDVKKVVNTMNSLCIEMDQRYDLLKKAMCRNIKEYNGKFLNRKLNPKNGHRYMPWIVVVVDEFADLIMTAGKEIETPIARLAQLARAIGIHLILATQRPSVNIITGTIKANFPARLSFKVTSKIDSRTILDAGGADQLIGRGDMLLSQGGNMLRIQCGFVDTPEVEKIVDHISEQQAYPTAFMLPEYVGEEEGGAKGGYSANDRDPLFEDAARIIVMNQMGSTSMIQRRMKLGYNRAGRIMDQLEDAGIVGQNAGSKAREVLFKSEAELEQYLQSLKETTG